MEEILFFKRFKRTLPEHKCILHYFPQAFCNFCPFMKKIICHKIKEYLKLLYDCAILNVFIYLFVTIFII